VTVRKASIAYGCNVDTLMKHYVLLDEQEVTDEVFGQMNGRKENDKAKEAAEENE